MNRDSVSLPHAKIGEIYKHIVYGPPPGTHCQPRRSFWTHTNLFIMVLDVQWDPANFEWHTYDVLRWERNRDDKRIVRSEIYKSQGMRLDDSAKWQLVASL